MLKMKEVQEFKIQKEESLKAPQNKLKETNSWSDQDKKTDWSTKD